MTEPRLQTAFGLLKVVGSGQALGSAFALSPTAIATARHVLNDVRLTDKLVFESFAGMSVPVESYRHSSRYDLAILEVRSESLPYLMVGSATEGCRWRAAGDADSRLIALTGQIDSAERRFPTATMLQLRVDQVTGDYHGYSGSAITNDSGEVVIGVLVEQDFFRDITRSADQMSASNILWALRIEAVIDEFELSGVVSRIPAEAAWPDRVAAVRELLHAATQQTASMFASRKRGNDGDSPLVHLRVALQTLQDAVRITKEDGRSMDLQQARRGLLAASGLDPGGNTGGIENSRWLTICHFGLHIVAELLGEPLASETHVLTMFTLDPHSSRTQYVPEYFRKMIRPHCDDLYESYRKEDKALKQRKFFPRELAQLSGITGGFAVGGAALAVLGTRIPPARPIGVLMVSTALRSGREALAVDEHRAIARERLRRAYAKKVDLRCAEVCSSALEAATHATVESVLKARATNFEGGDAAAL